jgi:flagellar biosynthesis/type III secretory pathway protein FliH
MEKTSIQELIEYLDAEIKMHDFSQLPAYEKAKQLLEKEKQVIEDAFNQGYRDGFSDAQSVTENDKDISEFSDAQDYYNQKFKQ